MEKLTFEEVRNRVNKNGYDITGSEGFQKDVEEVFDFSHFHPEVKSEIHYQAYERGHSGGYGEILNHYFDLVNLVKKVLQFC